MKKELPRCNFLNEDGIRCRKKSGIEFNLHCDNEIYRYPSWVCVNLCIEHATHYGYDFSVPKKNKGIKF